MYIKYLWNSRHFLSAEDKVVSKTVVVPALLELVDECRKEAPPYMGMKEKKI